MTYENRWLWLLRVLHRRWLVVAICVLAVPAFALVFSRAQSRSYSATAEVLLSRHNLATELAAKPSKLALTPGLAQIIATEARLAHTPAVAQLTLRRLGISDISASQLLENSTVSGSTSNDVLTFTVTDSDPDRTARLATGMAHAFVRYQLGLLDAPLRTALRKARADSGSPHSAVATRARAEVVSLRSLIVLQRSNAEVTQAPAGATLVRPRTGRNLFAGVVLGVVLGVALALLLESFVGTGAQRERELQRTERHPG